MDRYSARTLSRRFGPPSSVLDGTLRWRGKISGLDQRPNRRRGRWHRPAGGAVPTAKSIRRWKETQGWLL